MNLDNTNLYDEIDKVRSENNFISIQHLEKIYPNGIKAVYDFDLDIKQNEFIVIVGPSGCGKSTTLRMIAGLEDISKGNLLVNDELINFKSSKDRHMAMVFQSYALYPQMSVFDNIAFPLKINKYPKNKINHILKFNNDLLNLLSKEEKKVKDVLDETSNKQLLKLEPSEHLSKRLNISFELAELIYKNKNLILNNLNEFKIKLNEEINKENNRLLNENIKLNDNYEYLDEDGKVVKIYEKLSKSEIKQKVFNAAKILDLGQYLDRLPKELSGGQMQRVALGRALVKEVPIFLMDEPLSNLDAKLRLTMRSEIVKLHNKIKATTIYVTHDQVEAMTMANRIVVMSKGFIQQIGSPHEIYTNPNNIFVAKFIGSPSINIFEATYENDNLKVSDEINFKVSEQFKKLHDKFYEDKINLFKLKANNFNNESFEFIKKILSIKTEDKKAPTLNKKEYKIIKLFKNLFNKNKNENLMLEEEHILNELIIELEDALKNKHKLLLGIRPEHILVRFDDNNLKENEIRIKPSICELLGADYLIYFEYNGKDYCLKTDPKNKFNKDSSLIISFPKEDLFIFDPISGDKIK